MLTKRSSERDRNKANFETLTHKLASFASSSSNKTETQCQAKSRDICSFSLSTAISSYCRHSKHTVNSYGLAERQAMYSQYQYYQQQQQQQQATTTHASSSQSYGGTNNYTSYQSTQPASTRTSNPVEHFTKAYHGWQAHGNECEAQLRMIPDSDVQGRQEVQRRVDWAKFYADQSSRAAHHFYSNPNTPAPFDLPPDPPQTNTTVKPIHSIQQPTRPTNASLQPQDDAHTPGTLTKYVKNCLNRCSTQEQKKAVQAQIEKKIAAAIQKGDLHSQNWDLVPLIPVPGAESTAIPNQTNFSGFQIQHPKNMNQFRAHTNKLPQNDSYYGHSITSSPSMHPTTSASTSNTSYYGPAASGVSTFQSSNSSHTNPASSLQDASYSFTSQKRKANNDQLAVQSRKGKKSKQMKGFQASTRVLAKRANRFSGPGGISDASASNAAAASINGHEKYMGKGLIGGSNKELDEQDFERMTVKGTCTTLEKEYLRLTAPPRAELVRPQPILEKHLANLKSQYAEENRKEYLWFCSQLKAVRQDCTVQRIQDEFAVDVYETHARIALREGKIATPAYSG